PASVLQLGPARAQPASRCSIDSKWCAGLNFGGTHMKRLWIAAMSVAVLAAAGTAAAQDAKAVEKGVKVYAEQKCSMCHSIDGKGNAKGSLDGVGSKLKAEEIRQWIVEPAAMTAKTKS